MSDHRTQCLRLSRWCNLVVAIAMAFAFTSPTVATAEDVVASVNGSDITQADLQLEAILRRIPEEELSAHREMLLEELIDQRLIESYLARRKTKANPVELEAQVERLEAFIRRRGEEPAALYERLSLTDTQVRERLGTSLAWTEHVRRITSDQKLRAYFAQHRRELDGTELRAAQIILKASADDAAARQAAREELAGLREQIASGTITFEAAAAEHSQGPSAKQGGDVGFFAYRGTMPAEFADAGFRLKVGEISDPIESPFGVHLIKVTDERPGQLSLEDARPQILERISKELWDEQIAADRREARITRSDP